jgi:DNA gyrase subunit A
VENFPVKLLLTSEGYFKKIAVTPRTQFSVEDQKMKDGDSVKTVLDAENRDELVFFTDRCQVYRAAVDDFDCLKAAAMGDYLNTKLKMDEGEKPIYMEVRKEYPEGENYIFVFENGKAVRVPVTAYVTKGNRRKLTGAYSEASPIVAVFTDTDKKPIDILMISSLDRAILVKSTLIPVKTTRTSGGVQIMTLKKGAILAKAVSDFGDSYQNVKSYRKLKVPASGTLLEEKNVEIQQIKMDTD